MNKTPDNSITRRTALLGATAIPLAAGIASVATPALADGHAKPQPNANKYGFKLGEMEVATLLVGSRAVPEPQKIFGMNVSPEGVQQG